MDKRERAATAITRGRIAAHVAGHRAVGEADIQITVNAVDRAAGFAGHIVYDRAPLKRGGWSQTEAKLKNNPAALLGKIAGNRTIADIYRFAVYPHATAGVRRLVVGNFTIPHPECGKRRHVDS